MSTRFWNFYATRYAASPIANPQAYEVKLAATREHLDPSRSVLEFGCGTGSTALLHAPLVQRIVGIDTSKRMVQIATDKARDEGVENVEFRLGTVFDITDGPYDVVLGLNVLHLVDDLDATLAQCAALTKPGGMFITSTACIEGGWEKWVMPLAGLTGLLPRLLFFGKDELVTRMEAAGFEVLSCTTPGSPTGVFIVAVRR